MMSQTTENKNQKLFMYLVGTFQSSAWIALGKMKNPMTKKVDKNINQASFYIDLLDMNKTLMDLDDGIISGQTKLKVKEIVERPIQRIIKHRFQTMFLEDKMYTALPNLNSWLATTFNRMNFIAEETHK